MSIYTKKPRVTIWYLTRFLKPYARLIWFTMIFLVAGQVFASLDPIWLKKIIDGITAGHTLSTLGMVIGVYFLLRTLAFLSDFVRDVLFAPAEMGIARNLSDELFKHLLELPISYHVEQKIGGTTRKITRGSRTVTFLLDFLISSIIPTLIELVIVTALLFKLYSPVYALVTFITVVTYGLFTIWATEKRQKYRQGSNIADDEVGALEADALTNIDTIKYFNNESLLRTRYQPAISKRHDLQVISNQLYALVAAGQSAILLIGLGIIFILGIRQTLAHQLTIGDLVLLTTYIVRLSVPINVLSAIYRQIKDGLADLEGMANILYEESTIREPLKPKSIPHPQGEVTFDKVSFAYNSKRDILKDINLAVKPGERVAFVGPSGVGKSTIVKLLFRLFEPTAGHILVDGVALEDLSKDTRRALFAIVPQEPALFNSTIGENIRFGKPDATQEEVETAAKLASIDHFIQGLPEKYDTVVGERGVKLSGGEKQRVAIARAIIRDPKILVFDEATSSLDSKSEQDIQQALDTVAKGRTTLAVAHRLSTIANSDRIYVLNQGAVAEQGTHQVLLAMNGIYARLWKLQANHKEEDI